MTTKTAIFTEGKTEQALVCKLIEYFAGEKTYHVSKTMANGGRKFELIEIKLSHDGVAENEHHDYYFTVLNCGNEDHVVSMLKDRIAGLLDSGYSHMIGVRDLRPRFKYGDIEKLYLGSMQNFKDIENKPLIVIARMEVEAWFIADNDHFLKINDGLTAEKILAETGIDVSGDSEKIEVPNLQLNRIYGIVGKEYTKSGKDINRTVDALDIAKYSGEAGGRAPTIIPLIERIEKIFRG